MSFATSERVGGRQQLMEVCRPTLKNPSQKLICHIKTISAMHVFDEQLKITAAAELLRCGQGDQKRTPIVSGRTAAARARTGGETGRRRETER